MGGGPYASTNTLGSMVLHQSYIWPENEYINEYVGGLVLGTNGDTQTSGSMFADASNRIDTIFITNIPCYLIMNGGVNDMVPTVGNQTALTAWLRWSNSITTRLLINPGWRPYYWLYGNCSNNPTTTSRLIEFNGRLRTNNPVPQCAYIDFGGPTFGAGGNNPYDQRMWNASNPYWYSDTLHGTINAHRQVYSVWTSLPFTASRRSTAVITQ